MKAKKVFSLIFGLVFMSMIAVADVQEDKSPYPKRIRENIQMLRLLKMTKVLDLTEEQASKIFPAMNRNEKEKVKINKEIGQKIKELKLILSKEIPDESEIHSIMEDLKRLRSLLKSKDEELENVLEENLTVIQRAKYLLFIVDFSRELRETVNRARLLQERIRKRDIK
jgi:Spy/CpxP family protein refolding chaperone